MAPSVISLKVTLPAVGAIPPPPSSSSIPFPPIPPSRSTSLRCQAMASPSLSSSVARITPTHPPSLEASSLSRSTVALRSGPTTYTGR